MNADQEVKFMIGELLTANISMKHQVNDLSKRLAEADAKIAELEKAAKPEEPPA